MCLHSRSSVPHEVDYDEARELLRRQAGPGSPSHGWTHFGGAPQLSLVATIKWMATPKRINFSSKRFEIQCKTNLFQNSDQTD